MMKNNRIKWLFLLFVLGLSACNFYKPGYIQSPKFEEKGEMNVGLHLGSNIGGVYSYSPFNNLAFLAEFSNSFNAKNELKKKRLYYRNQDYQKVADYHYRNIAYALAAGTYWKYNDKLYQDFYLGYARGSSAVKATDNEAYFPKSTFDLAAFEGAYHNLFLQSSFNVGLNKTIDLSLNARVNFLNYHSFNYVFKASSGYFPSVNPYSKNRVENFFRTKDKIAIQFGFRLNAKLDHFNLFYQHQIGISENLKLDYFTLRSFSGFIGITVPLHQFWEAE